MLQIVEIVDCVSQFFHWEFQYWVSITFYTSAIKLALSRVTYNDWTRSACCSETREAHTAVCRHFVTSELQNNLSRTMKATAAAGKAKH